MNSLKMDNNHFDVNPIKEYHFAPILLAKLGIMFFLSLLLVSCSSPEILAPSPESPEHYVLITITTPPYTLAKDTDGFDVIQIEDYSPSGIPGDPALPKRVFSIALPPNVDLNSLVVQVVDYQLSTLDGEYNIRRMEADLPSDADDTSGDTVNEQSVGDITGEDIIQQLAPGQMRKWLFTKVEYSPFHFDPETGSLSVVSEVQLRIVYDLSSAELDEDLLADDAMDDVAEETFINFDSAKDWYQLESSNGE